MKSFFRKKTFLIILVIYAVAIVASLFIVLFFDKNKILNVSAGASHNISGWAWNNQAGWISFNSTDCDANDDGLSDGNPPGCPQNTITTIDSDGDTGYEPSITIGTDGLPVISYRDSSNMDLKVAKCGNSSCSSGNIITTVDSDGIVGLESSITIGTDGLPVISYRDSSNMDLKVAKCGNSSCSSGNTITTIDSAGWVGFQTSITIGTDGLPVISYLDFSNRDLKVAKCGNSSCSSGNTITTIDSAGDTGYSSSITIGADGLPVVSYYDFSGTALKVAKCGNSSCSSGNTITTIDSAGDTGYDPSITIGTDGLPVISYGDSSNIDLKVAKCGNNSCSSGNTITTIDSAGMGLYNSITISTDGLPIISYYDWPNIDLKVAKCGNSSCSSGNTISTVDSAVDNECTSITIGTDGLPVISYYNDDNSDLKVAKCGNSSCNISIPNYGVNIDQDGNFSGYAWSSNAGWISFYKSDSTSDPPDGYAFNSNCSNTCVAANNCTACYNLTSKNIYGWAKIIALGNEGWIKFRKGSEGGIDYGVYVDTSGEFRNWAWNGNDTGVGLGWISFNCSNNDQCATSDYKVLAQIPTKPVIQSVAPDESPDSCLTLKVIWNNDVQYEDGFLVTRADNIGGPYLTAGGACGVELVADTTSCLDNTLAAGQTVYYKVTAKNIFGSSESDPMSGTTLAVCKVEGGPGIIGKGECPKTVHLSWTKPAGDAYKYIIKRCRIAGSETCATDNGSNYQEVTNGDGCFYPLTAENCVDSNCSCDNSDFAPDQTTDKYRYIIAAISSPPGSQQGDWSTPSNAIRPCPKLPKWKEVKAE